MKKARSEGNRVACLIKANKAEFYIADVDLEDEMDHVVSCVESARKTLGKLKTAFLLISAGTVRLNVVGYVPPELSDTIDIKEWINAAVRNIPGEQTVTDDEYYGVSIEADTPFKLKDMVRSNGFAYLKKEGLMNDEESSEEFVGFDDI